MARLNEAIKNQMNYMLETDDAHFTSPPETSEISNLLTAFKNLINAYLRRIGGDTDTGTGIGRPSDTFGTNG